MGFRVRETTVRSSMSSIAVELDGHMDGPLALGRALQLTSVPACRWDDTTEDNTATGDATPGVSRRISLFTRLVRPAAARGGQVNASATWYRVVRPARFAAGVSASGSRRCQGVIGPRPTGGRRDGDGRFVASGSLGPFGRSSAAGEDRMPRLHPS
jgi:hypothetical protein